MSIYRPDHILLDRSNDDLYMPPAQILALLRTDNPDVICNPEVSPRNPSIDRWFTWMALAAGIDRMQTLADMPEGGLVLQDRSGFLEPDECIVFFMFGPHVNHGRVAFSNITAIARITPTGIQKYHTGYGLQQPYQQIWGREDYYRVMFVGGKLQARDGEHPDKA